MFRQALTDIVCRLEQAKQQGLLRGYALVGGFAVSAWGVPRATHDIDFALTLGPVDPSSFAAAVRGQYSPAAPDDPLCGVITTSAATTGQAIPIQMILLPPRFTTVIFEGLQFLPIFDCRVPIVSWQILILLKLYAGGPQDLLDAQQLLAIQRPDPGTLRAIHSLAEAVNLTQEFAALIEQVGKTGRWM